jgi:putative hydrolase of the HAD superfamily
MQRIVLFDADGVVVERKPLFPSLNRDYGITKERLDKFFDGPYAECMKGKQDLKVAAKTLLDEIGWRGTVDDFLRYWFTRHTIQNNEMIDYIDKIRLNGTKCYLATNNDWHRTQYLDKEIGLGNHLEGIFSSCYIGAVKPENAFYEFCHAVLHKEYKIKRKDVLFIDDLQENIEAAQVFGFEARLFKGNKDFIRFMEKQKSAF